MKLSEINKEDIINLDDCKEQDLPYQCPDCRTEMTVKNVIGFMKYPSGGYRALMKPNNEVGEVFECPTCFTKSCFHTDIYSYQCYLDNKK